MAKLTFNKLKTTEAIWLPQVPEHWELVKVRHLFKESTKKGFPNETLLVASQQHGVVSKDAYGKRTVEATKDLHNLKLVEKGDFVISLRSFQGGIEVAHERGIISPAYTVMKETRQIEKRYFKNLFKSLPFISLMTLCVKGIREGQNIDYPTFKNEYLPLPPFEEQQAIAAYLDKKNNEIDKFIRNKERLIELIEERKSTIINEAICGRLGYNNNGEKRIVSYIIGKENEFENSKFEWIGKTPKEWQYKKLPWVSKFQEGPGLRTWQFTNEGVKVICVTNITEEGIDFSLLTRCISEKEYKKKYKHFTINKGDYLLASSGASWGKVAEYIDDENVILNTSTIRFNSANHQLYSKRFIKWAMKSRYMAEHLNLLLTGSCQPNFGPSHLQKLILNIPSIEEQNSIIEFIESELTEIHKSIKIINKEISSIKEYRESLITDLVTGKRSVPQLQMS